MSDARAVLTLLAELGVMVSLIGGRVKLVVAGKLPPAALEAAQAVRDDIATFLAKPSASVGHNCCVCGVTAAVCDGWNLRGPGGSRRYCAECRPTREAVMDVAGGLGKPSVSHEEARSDWWRQPVEGWAEGRLEIENMLTGVKTVVDLRGGYN
jgi:hypothetical protein